MKNPFNHENYPSNRIKRNAFPLSFQYNGTFEYGKIYPVGLIRVPNAGTYKIEPTLALNFMPTVFPVQTRQKAYLHFFYGRDRNFWNEYKDFVHGLKPNLVKPYLDESVTKARTGNLLDYLGVPTTIVGKYASGVVLNTVTVDSTYRNFRVNDFYGDMTSGFTSFLSAIPSVGTLLSFDNEASTSIKSGYAIPVPPELYKDVTQTLNIRFYETENYYNLFPNKIRDEVYSNGKSYSAPMPRELNNLSSLARLIVVDSDYKLLAVYTAETLSPDNLNLEFKVNLSDLGSSHRVLLVIPQSGEANYSGDPVLTWSYVDSISKIDFEAVEYAYEPRDIDDDTSPYWRSDDTRGKETIKLNAIPCRMYESIYNLYFRNPQNNPYILNGVPEYNIFTPTLEGGVDKNLYQLRYRNWADDFLTTATQTPQQGIAPLIGLTDRGATITLTNEDGSITRYKTTLDDNGNLTGVEATDSSEPILTQALVDAVTYGISIEDIRNVNKMQKWLELNLRKGYQYKDVIEARWGISISYNELNLPEFIGGFTQEVSMQAVTQTANIDDSITGQLGWQAGRMYCAKDGREITHYCDEAGYIMVLLSVAPMPNYSQLLPKHWFTRDLLEEYQPEFNHIGFQPITYKEVCPVQAYQESTANNNVLEQTFGYQRPWYEYMSMPDEVHGQFRTTLKDYLINRVFDVKPELSESFLLVDPEQINDVFNVTDSDDKILGAINYNIIAKLPISEYATVSIE